MDTPNTISSQERIAGLLAYILFFIPMLMGVKTEFSMFHAKQSFMILIVLVAVWIVSAIFVLIPIIGWLLVFVLWVMQVLAMIMILWSAYRAYLGYKFIIPYL
jgi:uncharacterized membrane protein